jgi:hypothetical protein
MVEFRFVRRAVGPPHGFELGDTEVIGNRGSVSSAGHHPDRGHMIYVSVSDLLDGLRALLDRGHGSWQFVGADSSFILNFTLRRGRMTTRAGQQDIDESPAADVASAVWTAARALAEDPATALPPGDPVRADLAAAIEQFARLGRGGAGQ